MSFLSVLALMVTMEMFILASTWDTSIKRPVRSWPSTWMEAV